jgi:hypothetical protein
MFNIQCLIINIYISMVNNQHEDHSQSVQATAVTNQPPAGSQGQQTDFADLAASLQSIMSQHIPQPQNHLTGGNPFAGLFPGTAEPR